MQVQGTGRVELPGKDLALTHRQQPCWKPSFRRVCPPPPMALAPGFSDKLPSASVSVFRVGAAGSSEFLSILVYPLVGHPLVSHQHRTASMKCVIVSLSAPVQVPPKQCSILKTRRPSPGAWRSQPRILDSRWACE